MSINEPSADALDLLMYFWGELPETHLQTKGEQDHWYVLFRELERAGYLHLSRASNFKHKVWLTKTGIALASMLPPLDKGRIDYFSNGWIEARRKSLSRP